METNKRVSIELGLMPPTIGSVSKGRQQETGFPVPKLDLSANLIAANLQSSRRDPVETSTRMAKRI